MEPHEQHNLTSEHDQQEQDFVSAPNVVRTDKNLVVKDFFIVNDTEARMLKGQTVNRKAISTLLTGAHYTLSTSDYIIGITNLSYAPFIGLPKPSLVGNGKTFRVKDEAGGAATTTITVQSDGEKTIDGSASTTLTSNYQSKSFYSDGSNWFTY